MSAERLMRETIYLINVHAEQAKSLIFHRVGRGRCAVRSHIR